MQDKIVLILGGSSGIGAATARLLAARGAHVTIAAPVPQQELDTVVATIKREGGRADALPCDVTDKTNVDMLFEAVIARHGRVDIVVNSAGYFAPTPVFAPDAAATERLIAVNMLGAMHVAFAAIRAMQPTGGVLVMVTSTQSIKAEPGSAVYAATKAGMAHFIAGITPELQGTGIRAVSVAPGATRTPMIAPFTQASTPEAQAHLDLLNKRYGGAYGHFFLEAEQVAEVIAFAASDAAGPLQGVSLIADQGYTSAMPGLPGLGVT